MKPMTLREAKTYLPTLGVTIRHENGEYRVNLRYGGEATAYYTTDLEDAIKTGEHMGSARMVALSALPMNEAPTEFSTWGSPKKQHEN